MDLKNYLHYIDDNKNITELTLPWTHDSCSTSWPSLFKCQSIWLVDQLNMGIRFFDIRCRHIDDKFHINHGAVYDWIKFDGVRDIFLEFLKENPSEFIAMSIKKEYSSENNTMSFESTLKEYLNGYEDWFFLEREFPFVKDIRSKIVLISRYDSNTMGIDMSAWENNKIFSIWFNIMIQDVYKPKSNGNKWDKIINLLNLSEELKINNIFFLNFCSATIGWGDIHNPQKISNDINSRLSNYFFWWKKWCYGIIIMDFPNQSLAESLVWTNL